jgi:hypothetical protein
MSQQATVVDAGYTVTGAEAQAMRRALTDLDIFGFAMENPFSHETRQSGIENNTHQIACRPCRALTV